jgi:hypothetical protein
MVTAVRRWRQNQAGGLLLAHWLVLLIVRALPGTPPHDGVRLFLPSFAFLAALAGVGCGEVFAWAARRWPSHRRGTWLAVAATILLFAGSGSSLLWYAPQWLSYYNLLIGGLPGATALGMEPTYYWDGLDRSVRDWLAEHTGPGEKVYFAAAPPENLRLMRRWKMLGCATQYDDSPGSFRWYVLQDRPSGWQPADRRLIEEFRPAHVKTIRAGGWGPWRLDVPLVEVYDCRQYVEARQATTTPQSQTKQRVISGRESRHQDQDARRPAPTAGTSQSRTATRDGTNDGPNDQ